MNQWTQLTLTRRDAAFDRNLNASHLNHVLNIAKMLTYRQLVIAGIIGSHDLNRVRGKDFRGCGSLPIPTIGVLYEVYQMVGLDLIVSKDSSYMMGVSDINPSQLRLQGIGADLFNLLRPNQVPSEDQQFFYDAFPAVNEEAES